jgi:hypothetical protein
MGHTAGVTQPGDERATGAGLMRPGKLSYIQLPAVDAQASATFYEACFGWTIRGDSAHVSFTDASGELIGAWMTDRAISREPGILPYISVTAIDRAVDSIKANGGKIVREPYPEGDLWVATFRDPAGNVVGIWQMGPRQA